MYLENIDMTHADWYELAVELAESINVSPSMPRRAGAQRHRNNIPADNPEEYYKRSISIPMLGE